MERGNKKNILIGALVAVILFMAVGYAAFASLLTINGSTTITGSWGVEFTNLTKSATGGAVEATPSSYDATSVVFDVEFNAPGDTMTYTITVKNTGTITAELDSIIATGLDGTDPIVYTISGISEGETLAANDTKTFNIVIEYDSDSEPEYNYSKTLAVTLNFVQAS